MSKFCKISTEHPDLYTDWRDAFLSGSYVVVNPDYSVSEINAYEEFLTREISDNWYTLSKSDKYSMVTSILGSLTVAEKDTVLPSGKRVEDALTELKNSFKLGAGNKAPMKAVTNPHLSAEVGQKIKRPLDTQSELSQFIPVVSPRVNHFIIDFLYSKFKELCLWHEDGDQSVIVSSDSDLTLAIESYKRSLIDILQKYCNYHNEISTGESLITQETIDNYNELMNLTWNKIKGLVEVNNGEIDIEVTSESIQTVVNPIMAFYVLQNFDKVINQILSDFVVVDARYINSLESDSEKYKQKNRKKNNASWNDDVHSSNAENIEDKLLTTFVTGTVDEITKLPLSKDFVETMVVTFKSYVENIGEIPEIIEILTNDSIPSREKVTTLINFLKAPTNASGLKELSQVGYSACRSLGERLDQYMKAYDKKYEKASSKDREYMDLKQNVGIKLLNAFNKGVLEYVQIKENSNTAHLQAGSKKKSKEYVRSRIRKALLNRLSETNGYRQFEEGLIIGNTYADYIVQIDSDNIVNYLSYITGINFRDDEFRERMHRHIPDLMRFVRKYRRIVRNHLSESNLETKVQNILDELSWDTDYITFSDIVINENQYTLERIFSQDGDEQPKTTITTVTTQQARRIKQFQDEIGSDNILLANGSELIKQTRKKLREDKIISKGDFIQHIGYAGDVNTATGNKRWVALNEKEIAEAWLNSLYLRSVVNSNIASFQIDAASDKVKVPIGHINLDSKIGDELLSGSIDSLIDKCFAQHASYYNKVEQMVLYRWSVLLGQKFASLSDLSTYLSTNPITVESVSDLIRNVQKSNKDFIFQNQIDYVISNGILTLNNSLLKEIARGKSRQAWLEGTQKAYEQFATNISKYNPQIDLRGLTELKEEQKLRFCQLFGINTEKELKTKTIHGIFTELLAQLRQNPYFAKHSEFLKRFYYMYNLIREADLELFQKHYWTHADNKSDIFEEETNRINKGKKRNNALSATWSPLAQGLTYGVPARIRTATIESMTTPVVNNFGDVETLNAHDGAIYSSYIMRLLERASSPDIHMADTTKIIALCPEGAGFEQIKCADYSMTNDWIMGSVKQSSGNPQFMDGHMLMKKMLSPAVLSATFYNALYKRLLYGNLNTGLQNVIFTFNGRRAILKEFFPDVNNRGLSATWQYLDYDSDLTDEENTVPMEVVAKTLGLELDPELGILRVENLYDLWKFFGAEYSESNSEEGIDFSNISQEIVTTLMCEFDPSLKEQMIGKIIDIQASKSTQHWMNTREEVFKEGVDLITGYLDTVQYGAQQDYSHQSEEDTVSSLTQVIGAIALNGENSELAQELYQLLGKITADALQDITIIYADTNKDAFYKKLGKELANSLKSNKVVSNAEVIIKEALKKIGNSDQFFSTKALPISTNQLYHLVTSELLTKLNRIIRQRFSGMAVVQNPAQGIIGLYQDNQGNVFTKREIVKRAQEWGAKQKQVLQTIDDLVASYIEYSKQFEPIRLDLTNVHYLNIGHVVEIDGEETFHIQSPQDLVRVHELVMQGTTVEQIFNVPRNLATTQISWNDANTGEGMNMWLMKSTQELIKEQEANRKLAKVKLPVPKLSVVKDWHNANMRGLADKTNPYYYKTLEDYQTGTITSVVNLKYQAGEEVLPKQYRTKLGLSEDLGYILEQKEEYFESLLKGRYELSDDISLQAYNDVEHQNTFALATNYFDIVFTDSAIEVDNNSFTEVYNGKLKVLDETGEEIPNLLLPNIPCDVQYSKRNNKDLIVVKVPEGYFNNPAQYLAYVKQVLSEIKYNTINIAAKQNADASGAFWQNDPEIQTYLQISKNNQKPQKIKEEAVKTYNSFLLSLQTISARIPSQSFQSFLSNHTVAFTKTADNDGYMNLWEMWFQGSKL